MNIWRNAGETDCTDGVDNDNNGFVDDCHGYNHADDTAGDASSGNYLGAGSHGSHCPARSRTRLSPSTPTVEVRPH